MGKERYAVFKAEINDQVQIIKKLFEDVEQRSKGIGKSAIKREALGYKLHALYCAFENLFKITANYFENNIDSKKAYHRELLKRMKIEIPGVRPHLLSEKSFKLLDELRGFRHYFRHAYEYELDTIKLKNLVRVVAELQESYLHDIEDFLKNLE